MKTDLLSKRFFFEDTYLLFTCFLAFTLPLSTSGNGFAVTLAATFILLASSFKRISFSKLKDPLILSLIFFYFIHIIGFFYTQNKESGLTILLKRSTLLILPLFFIIKVNLKKGQTLRVILSYIFSLTIAGLTLLIKAVVRTIKYNSIYSPNSYTFVNENHFLYHSYSEILGHAIYLGAFFAIGLAFLIYLIKENLFNKKLSYVLIFFFSLQLLLLTPRIILLYLILFGIPILIIYSYSKKVNVIKILVVGMVYIFLGFLAYQVEGIRNRINDVTKSSFTFLNDPNKNDNRSMDGVEFRLAKWHFTIEAIKKKGDLIFGVGTGGGQEKLEEVYKENNFVIGYVDHFNSHNQFLTTLLDNGLIGLVSYLWIFSISFYRGFKYKNLILLFTAGLIFSFSITETILGSQKGVLLLTFFIPFTATLLPRRSTDNT